MNGQKHAGNGSLSGTRSPLTTSPLAAPSSPIEVLATRFADYLHFPDPQPMYALMGAAAGSMMTGDPVWFMLVGASSRGGTEVLSSLLSIRRVVEADDITGKGAFLSATPKKDRAKGATGGILRVVGDCGAMVMKDFTSLLDNERRGGNFEDVMDSLRHIYDGRWTRQVGGEGGQVLHWKGKVSAFAKCTDAIDKRHDMIAQMGTRWVYYRYDHTDGWGETNRALDNVAVAWREELRETTACFFDGLGLSYENPEPRRTLSLTERSRMIALATFSARCRAAVERDPYRRDITEVCAPEMPTRLAKTINQIYLGCERIGLPPESNWTIASKVALDCMPGQRGRLIAALLDPSAYGRIAWYDVKQSLKCADSHAKRVAGDLAAHGVIEQGLLPGTSTMCWRLTEWSRQMLYEGWGMDVR